jgi:hypothetical protein
MAKFQQRHFEFIAAFFAYELSIARGLEHEHPTEEYHTRVETTEGIVRLLAQRFAQDNPKFKPKLFFKASNLQEAQ